MIKVIALVGSLRKESYNLALAKYVQEAHKDTLDVEIVDINLPLFNEDIEADPSTEVTNFMEKLGTADAFLFVTPEYNHSVSGVLKNAIDWASRGKDLNKKPAFIMGASPGATGAARAQTHLRQILDTKEMYILPANEVFVNAAHTKIAEGVLQEEGTKKFIDATVAEFTAWYQLVN